jgi:N-acyl-L-homoserine lactone synthetase
MKVSKEVQVKLNNVNKIIYFGIPTNSNELEEMFRLRYEEYSKRGYIKKELFPSKTEQDRYDKENKCTYFIAIIDNKVIGTARLIKDYYLPTEKDGFNFNEPETIKAIPREKRGEIGRLIYGRYNIDGKFFPRHVIMLGIIEDIVNFALKEDLIGGYSFVKKSSEAKFKKIGLPFHEIKPFTQIYSEEHLEGYFNDKKDPAIPIYYLREENKEYLDRIFNNKKIFKRTRERKYILLTNSIWRFLFYIKTTNLKERI